MSEVKSRKLIEAEECLAALTQELASTFAKVFDSDIRICVSRVDEELGVVVLHGAKLGGSEISPFILREPALSQFEKKFKERLPWITRVVDSVVYCMEKLGNELGVEVNSRQITG